MEGSARIGAARMMARAVVVVKPAHLHMNVSRPYLFLMRVRTSNLVIVAILGCTPVVDPQLPPGGAPLDETEQVLKAQYTGVAQRERTVIRDAQAWSRFWSRAHSTVMPQPPVPSIDFTRNMVVAAAMGTRSNGGFSIDIAQVYAADDDLHVVVEERSPGANCITTQALTAPVAAVRIPRVGASVSFIERNATVRC
jgi:hypothetical protein